MTAHLPGPWKIIEHTHGGLFKDETWGFTHIVSSQDAIVTTVYGTGPDSFGRDLARANARLIVKAPELLDVLKQLIEISDEPPETATASVDRLEAALVRARGLLNELQPKENDNASTTGN